MDEKKKKQRDKDLLNAGIAEGDLIGKIRYVSELEASEQ